MQALRSSTKAIVFEVIVLAIELLVTLEQILADELQAAALAWTATPLEPEVKALELSGSTLCWVEEVKLKEELASWYASLTIETEVFDNEFELEETVPDVAHETGLPVPKADTVGVDKLVVETVLTPDVWVLIAVPTAADDEEMILLWLEVATLEDVELLWTVAVVIDGARVFWLFVEMRATFSLQISCWFLSKQ